MNKWTQAFKHAFSMETEPLGDDDRALVDRVASAVAARGLATPALLALEGHRPLHRVAGQALVLATPGLVLLEPVLRTLLGRRSGGAPGGSAADPAAVTAADLRALARILESNEGMDLLVTAIEEAQA